MGVSACWGWGSVVKARRAGPRVVVDGVVPMIGVRGGAFLNGTPCLPGAVTTWLVNAATLGAGRSLEGSVCGELARSVTGARAAIVFAGRCRGATRGRLSTGSRAGSKAVSCPRELNSCLTSSSEKSWVTASDGFGRAVCGRSSFAARVSRRTPKIHVPSLVPFSACLAPGGRERRSAGIVPRV